MKLLFLGAGSGIGTDFGNFQSNMLLFTDSGKKLLIDCGTDIRFSLTRAGYLPQEIDAVYISHLHADHIGGMEWFAFQRKFVSQNGLSTLIIHENLVQPLWEHSLSGGLRTLEEKEATLNDYFSVRMIKEGQAFHWEGLQLNLVQTVHIFSNGELMPSYGLTIRHKGKSFFITTDAQFTPDRFEKHYREATLIFHDCETLEVPSGVHTHFKQLDTLDPKIKAKLWLYHYNDGELPNAKSHGFAGFVQCGQEFDLS
ncbi:MBL fold metallo-hydrolase [Fluoribacter dumoffii]|uniref:Ribonuclease Z n=1 Tax=Fluoribacter dumoffii TaxID=463 RepID=A0A377GDX0_9GAMM|nr:MBL fold metallo-hydrolase [Fluoribacter dumoffii]KTC90832.1 metal-dependent hydrolase of the beta-lactamase superfamily transporter III [Fluoribacter dumoffii NY 23]MCW8386676.1 MBL fold metallo-hydrolase [Fluoribacter dumoffii]MCW8419731.1 MBL fold metallo-hydrolase [Fluoribacter dumoffii]MCW8455566.1 MBL fold metallo-hydrolase [Fluoribacter dumoffii]MCW8460354.1 MBL fold metallo-hydrolase [Fluoribacter dumoffii]